MAAALSCPHRFARRAGRTFSSAAAPDPSPMSSFSGRARSRPMRTTCAHFSRRVVPMSSRADLSEILAEPVGQWPNDIDFFVIAFLLGRGLGKEVILNWEVGTIVDDNNTKVHLVKLYSANFKRLLSFDSLRKSTATGEQAWMIGSARVILATSPAVIRRFCQDGTSPVDVVTTILAMERRNIDEFEELEPGTFRLSLSAKVDLAALRVYQDAKLQVIITDRQIEDASTYISLGFWMSRRMLVRSVWRRASIWIVCVSK